MNSLEKVIKIEELEIEKTNEYYFTHNDKIIPANTYLKVWYKNNWSGSSSTGNHMVIFIDKDTEFNDVLHFYHKYGDYKKGTLCFINVSNNKEYTQYCNRLSNSFTKLRYA